VRVAPLLARAWLATAVVDGLFASALSRWGYHSTITRLWQGVASTVVGPTAFERGFETVLLGLVMHVGVALVWSTVFVALVIGWPTLRRAIGTALGAVIAALVYGPAIWLVMSLAVIPTLTGRAPQITARWWIQLAGHVVFVALPMIVVVARGLRAEPRSVVARGAESVLLRSKAG
jgi:hypothetical protein